MFSRPTKVYPLRSVSYETENTLSKTELRTGVGTNMKILERLLSIEATNKPLQSRRKAERQRKYGVWSYAKDGVPSIGDVNDIATSDNADDRQMAWRDARHDSFERRRWNSGHSTTPLDLQHMKYAPKHQAKAHAEPRGKPLRLPPVLLPPIYTVRPAPLHPRLLLTPTYHRGPICDAEWEELKECRYLRDGLSKFKTVNQSVS